MKKMHRFYGTRHSLLILGASLLGLASTAQAVSPAHPTADAIYEGGVILTINDHQPQVEALAVKNGRILAVGDRAHIEKLRGTSTKTIHLHGKTLLPGFIDPHAHFASFGTQAVGANLLNPPDGDVKTIDDVINKLKEFGQSAEVKRTGWIFGLGYDDALLGRHPTAEDLDKVSKEVPVMALHISGHFSAVNTAGLKLIGYNASTKDPEGGVIRRKEGSQEPNGVLEELASFPAMMKAVTPPKQADQEYFMQRGLELAKSFGYTTAQEGRAFAANHKALVSYAQKYGFDIDVNSYIDFEDRSLIKAPWYGKKYNRGYRIAGMKITLDGSPQGRTAWRTTPYLLPPDGQQAGYKGYPAIPDDKKVLALLDEANQKNWQVQAHTNGDAAVDQFLNNLDKSLQKYHKPENRRHVIIHGQFIREDQLKRAGELNVIPSLFPMHTFYWGDWYDQIVGPEQAQKISMMRTALKYNPVVTGHTDAPVALPNLMQIVSAAVNRTSRSGKVMGPDERLTPIEALKTITLWSAYQSFEEKDKGSLEKGKLADMVILSDNPLTIDPAKLGTIQVLQTIKAGKVVYTRK